MSHFLLCQGIWQCSACVSCREKKNASVQPQTSICLKKRVLQHLRRGLHRVLASRMCSVTYSTPSFFAAFHWLIPGHPWENFAGERQDLHCFVTGRQTNTDPELERTADCCSCTYVKILLIYTSV